MKNQETVIRGSLAAAAMAVLILDSKTALAGAQKGVELCIQTVIPSLFPFFILSILLTGAVTGRSFPVLRPLCRLFHIPEGAEGLLAAGFFGGYPVGAQCVSQAFERGQLQASVARRMIVICNNCGPAFLFGMAGAVFRDWRIPWLLWAVQIVSVLILAQFLPGDPLPVRQEGGTAISLPHTLDRALRAMATVCGWVVLFRVVLAFLEGWVLWLLPLELQIALSGLMELSNGCYELCRLQCDGFRFLLCAGMLNFGGLCVGLQTMAVTASDLDRSLYFPGKVFQCSVSLVLAYLIQLLLFPMEQRWVLRLPLAAGVLTVMLIFGMILRKSKICSSIPHTVGV